MMQETKFWKVNTTANDFEGRADLVRPFVVVDRLEAWD